MSKYNWDEKHIITFPEEKVALSTKDLHVYYGKNESIKGIDMQFEKNKITALIGPSGSGKSTYLRSLNRMNDTIDIAKVTGQILYQGIDVNRPEINVYEMRKHIGMVFQRPNPLPSLSTAISLLPMNVQELRTSKSWMKLWKPLFVKLPFGIRSKTICTSQP